MTSIPQQQQQPWWSKIFYDLYNLGTKDPEGNYWKPDVNVQLPGNYPIQALLPGTVTSLQNTGYGQDMATISLDQPLNPSATHTFYEHMSSFAQGLKVGQHVSSGQLIGYNNPQGQVPLGFGLYSGDVYGSNYDASGRYTGAWSQLQQDLAPGGAGMLNPQPLLNAVQSGKSLSGAPCSNCADGQWCILGNCVDVPGITGAKQAADAWSGVAGQTGHILQNLTNPDFWIRVGIGIGAIILVIMGMQLFIKDTAPAQQATQTAKQTAKIAAVAA